MFNLNRGLKLRKVPSRREEASRRRIFVNIRLKVLISENVQIYKQSFGPKFGHLKIKTNVNYFAVDFVVRSNNGNRSMVHPCLRAPSRPRGEGRDNC